MNCSEDVSGGRMHTLLHYGGKMQRAVQKTRLG